MVVRRSVAECVAVLPGCLALAACGPASTDENAGNGLPRAAVPSATVSARPTPHPTTSASTDVRMRKLARSLLRPKRSRSTRTSTPAVTW